MVITYEHKHSIEYSWRESERDVVEKMEWESVERKKVWRDKVEREIRRGGRKSGVRNWEKKIEWEILKEIR